MLRFLRPLLVGVALASSALAAEPARTQTEPLDILWLGSSSTPPHLVRFVNTMLEASGREIGWSAKVRTYFNTAFWVRHAEGLDLRTGNGKPFETCVEILREEAAQHPPDFVVIQVRRHNVMFPEIEAQLPAYMQRFCAVVREVGAEPVFFVAPGFEDPQEQQRLTDLVARMATQNHARVAWGSETLNAVAAVKGREYLKNMRSGDAGHVGPYGNFTYAAALYAALTGENPVNNPALEIYTTGWNVRFGDPIPDDDNVYATVVSEEDARFIRETAWRIYQELNP